MKNLVLNLSVIFVAYSLLNFLPTLKRSAKMQNFVYSLCFLASFISAFSMISLGEITMPAVSEQIEEASLNKETFCMIVGDMLKKEGIEYEKIEADATENGDKSININKIYVFGCSKKEKCVSLIKENTGLDEVYAYE